MPQFYLRGFCRNDSFAIFDRETVQYRRQTPINTAVQTHFYSRRTEDGGLDPEIEKILSMVETGAAPLIAELDNEIGLTSEGKHILSVFAGLQIFRVPDYEKRHDELRRGILDRLGDVQPASEEEIANAPSVIPIEEAGPRVSAFELVQELNELENDPDLAHNDFLDMIIPMAMKIAGYLEEMTWMVVHPPAQTSFVTTDCPFQTLSPKGFDPQGIEGYGMATPGAVKILPLSSRSCLHIFDRGNHFGHITTTRRNVTDINVTLSITCDRYLIASDDEQVRHLVKRTGIDKQKRGPRLLIQ